MSQHRNRRRRAVESQVSAPYVRRLESAPYQRRLQSSGVDYSKPVSLTGQSDPYVLSVLDPKNTDAVRRPGDLLTGTEIVARNVNELLSVVAATATTNSFRVVFTPHSPLAIALVYGFDPAVQRYNYLKAVTGDRPLSQDYSKFMTVSGWLALVSNSKSLTSATLSGEGVASLVQEAPDYRTMTYQESTSTNQGSAAVLPGFRTEDGATALVHPLGTSKLGSTYTPNYTDKVTELHAESRAVATDGWTLSLGPGTVTAFDSDLATDFIPPNLRGETTFDVDLHHSNAGGSTEFVLQVHQKVASLTDWSETTLITSVNLVSAVMVLSNEKRSNIHYVFSPSDYAEITRIVLVAQTTAGTTTLHPYTSSHTVIAWKNAIVGIPGVNTHATVFTCTEVGVGQSVSLRGDIRYQVVPNQDKSLLLPVSYGVPTHPEDEWKVKATFMLANELGIRWVYANHEQQARSALARVLSIHENLEQFRSAGFLDFLKKAGRFLWQNVVRPLVPAPIRMGVEQVARVIAPRQFTSSKYSKEELMNMEKVLSTEVVTPPRNWGTTERARVKRQQQLQPRWKYTSTGAFVVKRSIAMGKEYQGITNGCMTPRQVDDLLDEAEARYKEVVKHVEIDKVAFCAEVLHRTELAVALGFWSKKEPIIVASEQMAIALRVPYVIVDDPLWSPRITAKAFLTLHHVALLDEIAMAENAEAEKSKTKVVKFSGDIKDLGADLRSRHFGYRSASSGTRRRRKRQTTLTSSSQVGSDKFMKDARKKLLDSNFLRGKPANNNKVVQRFVSVNGRGDHIIMPIVFSTTPVGLPAVKTEHNPDGLKVEFKYVKKTLDGGKVLHFSSNLFEDGEMVRQIQHVLMTDVVRPGYVTLLSTEKVSGPSMGLALYAALADFPEGPVYTGTISRTGRLGCIGQVLDKLVAAVSHDVPLIACVSPEQEDALLSSHSVASVVTSDMIRDGNVSGKRPKVLTVSDLAEARLAVQYYIFNWE